MLLSRPILSAEKAAEASRQGDVATATAPTGKLYPGRTSSWFRRVLLWMNDTTQIRSLDTHPITRRIKHQKDALVVPRAREPILQPHCRYATAKWKSIQYAECH
jgi:hypothetical protein